MATTFVILRSPANPWPSSFSNRLKQQKTSSQLVGGCCTIAFTSSIACRAWRNKQSLSSSPTHKNRTFSPSASLSPSSSSSSSSSSPSTSTKLYVSGLSFRTTEESLRNAFQNFGQLVEVNLVMDRIANRPRGFAFLRYETEEQSQKAIEGMHGKFLDGRVIFVEVAKPRSELRQSPKQKPRRY